MDLLCATEREREGFRGLAVSGFGVSGRDLYFKQETPVAVSEQRGSEAPSSSQGLVGFRLLPCKST